LAIRYNVELVTAIVESTYSRVGKTLVTRMVVGSSISLGGSRRRSIVAATGAFVIVYNELKNDLMGRLELDFEGIDGEFGGLSQLASTSVERCHNHF